MRNNVLLPKKLTEAITSTGLKGKGLQKGITFIEYLFYKMSTDEEELEKSCFINVPSLTIKSLIDRNYTSLFMDIFVKNKIIIRRPFAHSKEKDNMCFGYRIDDRLLDYSDISSLDLPPVKPSKKPVDELSYVVQDLKKIVFDIPGMIKLVQDLDVWSLVKLNSQIKEDPLELTPIFSKVKFKSNKSLADALALSKRIRKDLVQYDNRFFITHAQKFFKWKEITLKSSMLYAISKLNNSDFYASRNDTNFRLDTNLTNLKGDFFIAGLLSLDGEPIVDIDLKNSQPSLLSFVLTGGIFANEHLQPVLSGYTFPKIDKSQIDYQLFIQLAQSGLLYDHIATMLGWKRDQAKQNFIKTMFADAKWAGPNKVKIKMLFPTIVTWMDDFKRKNKNDLAVLLQRIESRIFIDHIYMSLREKGYTIFTKHDSILCRESQREEIKEIMCTILDTYNFKYRLK